MQWREESEDREGDGERGPQAEFSFELLLVSERLKMGLICVHIVDQCEIWWLDVNRVLVSQVSDLSQV